MDANKSAIAQACLDGAENGTMTFPQIVGTLMQAEFEGYAVDFRREQGSAADAKERHDNQAQYAMDQAQAGQENAGAIESITNREEGAAHPA